MDNILNLFKHKPNTPVEQIPTEMKSIVEPEPYVAPEIITYEPSIQHEIPFIDPMAEIYEASKENMIAYSVEEPLTTTTNVIYPSTFTGVSQTNFNDTTNYFSSVSIIPSPNVGDSALNT